MTVLGNVGGSDDAIVDGRGRLWFDPGADGPSLDWWVGASDRWHHPAEESGTAVSQQRIDGLPIVETAMRVPGGQVVHRAWCVAGPGGGDLAVVELENRSKEPVAVAALVRGARDRVAFDGDRTATIDGGSTSVFGRRPARTLAGDDEAVRDALAAGEGDGPAPGDWRDPVVAFVFPLAHTARLRIAVPLGRGRSASASTPAFPFDVDGLPDPEAVVRGWRGHVDAGGRVSVPDERLAQSVVAARTTLLIRADRSRDDAADIAAVARALDGWGHHDAAAVVLDGLVAHQRLNGRFGRKGDGTTAAVLAAWAAHARATGDAAWAEPLVEPAAKAAHRAAKDGGATAMMAFAQHAAAAVLDVAGQPDAAQLCRQRAAGLAAAPGNRVDRVDVDLDPDLDDDVAAARFLLDVRGLLVDDTNPEALTVLPAFPDEWLGQEVEAHRLPTGAGRISFAVRWHGPRPAILWELDTGDTAAAANTAATTIRCGLDPTWSADATTGEALLGLVEPAGGLPKVVAPLPSDAGTDAGVAPEHGESFG